MARRAGGGQRAAAGPASSEGRVHVDQFIATNQPVWDRLRELTARGGRRARNLSPQEVDELVRLYERTSTHLSLARSRYHDQALTAALTTVVARAGSVVYGTRPRTLRAAGRFVTETFPAAVWHDRWFLLASTVIFCIPALVIGLWLGTSPAALEAAAPEALREAYVTEDFADYYTNLASGEFAATVTTNNIRVGILAFASGILLAVPTVIVLALNGANLGFAWGLFIAAGEQPRFWGLIAPHGLLELTAVFVAGATGLRLGWTLIDPGDRRRGEALVEEGRRAIAVVIGLVGVFTVAGLIEGFVTGAPWPTWLRVGIGVLAEAAFLLLVVVRGREAARRGLTGALGETADRGWVRTA
jgi:uncharacterized membrane protein SpoIIM required for sporulation